MNVVETESQGVHLPWNRAPRRRHAQAQAIVIHLYAGEASKDWEKDWPLGVEIITLDVRDGQYVHDPASWKYMWDLAGSIRQIGVICGPPCRTVSRMLEKRPRPPRLRSRSDDERLGFSHLTESQQQENRQRHCAVSQTVGVICACWTVMGWYKMATHDPCQKQGWVFL